MFNNGRLGCDDDGRFSPGLHYVCSINHYICANPPSLTYFFLSHTRCSSCGTSNANGRTGSRVASFMYDINSTAQKAVETFFTTNVVCRGCKTLMVFHFFLLCLSIH